MGVNSWGHPAFIMGFRLTYITPYGFRRDSDLYFSGQLGVKKELVVSSFGIFQLFLRRI